MNFAIGWLDLLIVVVVLISAGYAIWRGFVAETLGILSWVAGAFATLYFGPWFSRFVRTLMSPEWLANVVGYGLVFLAVVIPLSFISFRFSESVKHSPVSQLDRAVGGAFGVVRGLAIVGLAYILFSLVTPLANHPRWIKEAALLPVVQTSAEVLLSLVPEQGIDIRPYASEPAVNRADDPIAAMIQDTQPVSTGNTVKRATIPKPKPSTGSNAASRGNDQSGYGATDRRALDRLIEATGNSGR